MPSQHTFRSAISLIFNFSMKNLLLENLFNSVKKYFGEVASQLSDMRSFTFRFLLYIENQLLWWGLLILWHSKILGIKSRKRPVYDIAILGLYHFRIISTQFPFTRIIKTIIMLYLYFIVGNFSNTQRKPHRKRSDFN